MIRHTKRAIILAVGLCFLLLGVVGLVLPFLQGILFIAIGLILLSTFFPSLGEWVEDRTRHYPKVHHVVLKTQQFVRRTLGEA